MSNEGIALLIMYVFVVFTIILPLIFILIGAGLSYVGVIDVYVIINDYAGALIVVAALLTLGAVLTYKYGPSLARNLMSDLIRVYKSHGVLDVFIHRRLVQLYLSLLIPAIIVYLINAGVIRVMGLYSAAFNGFLIAGSSNLVLMIMGVINLVLSTWLIVSVSYLQLRIATRRIVSRLGSAIGSTVGIAASTGTAAFVGSACGLGVCTVPISGVSPMAMVFMSIFDINALELIHYSSIVLLLLMLITSILLVIIHKSMVRGL